MININLPQLTKEQWTTIIMIILGSMLIFGAYLGGASLGAQSVSKTIQPILDDCKIQLASEESRATSLDIELVSCRAEKNGKAILSCEQVCQERVNQTIKTMEALCSPSH